MMQGDQTSHELLTNKVTVKLNVLGSFMKDGVLCNVNGCLIIAFDWNGMDGINCKLTEQTTQPGQFCYHTPHASVLSLRRGQGNRTLLLGLP